MNLKSIEKLTHAFIVRIWVEHREINGAEPKWTGSIEHVERGERVYFIQFDKLKKYITGYLSDMGIKDIDKTEER